MRRAALLFLAGLIISAAPAGPVDRGPEDVVLSADGSRLFTANTLSGTVSMIRADDGRTLAEVPAGQRPTNVALSPDGKTLLASAGYSGEVRSYRIEGDALVPGPVGKPGFFPRGLAVHPDGKRVFVALSQGQSVAELRLPDLEETRRIAVGRWPREMALSSDGSRLAVGVSGTGGVAVVDTATGKLDFVEDFLGLNLGQMQISRDNSLVYFPWVIYRQLPITTNNIKQGWVLGARIGRVKLGEQARREAITLDPQGKAVGDPTGIVLSADESRVYCTAAGTHELLIYRLDAMPFQDFGTPDHIDAELLKDREKFDRMPLPGRPTKVRLGPGGQLFVVNPQLNAVQVVDPVAKRIVRTIDVGGPAEPTLVRRGEAIFHDATRSLDQWYSCATCHFEGGTNSVAMDTRNDGRFGNYKVVLSLHNLTKTGPWTWHGWQKNLDESIEKSLVDSMLGPKPTPDDVKALVAYLATLTPPPNPNAITDAVKRGEEVFKSEKAGCARCHPAPYFTDGKIHTTGIEERGDVYRGYNPPSLVGVFDRPKLLHDGRAKTLREVLTKHHNPDAIVGKGELTEQELADLIAYLNSL
ncbi:MAG: beta-propeller fold lactonase family protein [Gemmataceae bacterium]|nr:beta-propeller fold lactonase family protein [Gemmataceae bacterium]